MTKIEVVLDFDQNILYINAITNIKQQKYIFSEFSL